MAIAARREAPEPVILAMPEKVTEETLLTLAQANPEYRFETMADGRLVVSPLKPRARSVTLYRSGCAPIVMANAESVAIGPEMPGFTLAAAAVFDASEIGESDEDGV